MKKLWVLLLSACLGLGTLVAQDVAQDINTLFERAQKGDAQAQYTLGLMYVSNRGYPQNYVQAVKWFRLAADQGDAVAQFNLGVMYDDGQGVPQDDVQAHKWYNLAAAQGDANFAKIRDLVAKQMTPQQIAQAQELKRNWKPKKK